MVTTVAMTAPVQAGGAEKLEVEKVPTGFQLCTLYGIVDLQTQSTERFGNKHRLGMSFEFPQQMRVFYEGDEPRPSSSYMENTYSMNEKSRLRLLVKGMLNRGLTDKEAEVFDISSLLGKSFVATVVHSADGKYANIDALSPLTDQSCKMFGLNSPADVTRINDLYFWAGVQGYQCENFKGLPNFIRDKIKDSVEGKTHIASGGTFIEPDPKDNTQNVAKKRKLIMIATDYTYEQYAATWTDEQLVEAGKARWEEPVAPPAPVSGPSSPAAPASPQAPQAPSPLPVNKMVMNDGSDPKDWYEAGWTDALIIEKGHGSMMLVQPQPVAPQAPAAPAGPSAPGSVQQQFPPNYNLAPSSPHEDDVPF